MERRHQLVPLGRQLLVRAGIVGIGLAAIVAGWGGSSPPTTAPHDDVASVAFSSAKEEREGRTLVAARERLVRRCMTAHGVAYPFAAPAPPTIPIADAPPSADGYGLFAQFAEAPRRRAAPSGVAYRRALLGSPGQSGTLHLRGGLVVRYRSTWLLPGRDGDALRQRPALPAARRPAQRRAQRRGRGARERPPARPRAGRLDALHGGARVPLSVARCRTRGPVRRLSPEIRPSARQAPWASRRRRPTAPAASARRSTERSHARSTTRCAPCEPPNAVVATSLARSHADAVERARRIVSG